MKTGGGNKLTVEVAVPVGMVPGQRIGVPTSAGTRGDHPGRPSCRPQVPVLRAEACQYGEALLVLISFPAQ